MRRPRYAKPVLLALMLVVLGGAASGDQPTADSPSGAVKAPQKTGKERLSGKAADEQRVNDCKVPPEQRGSRKRPTACARAKSAQ